MLYSRYIMLAVKAQGQHALREVIAGDAAKAHHGDEFASLELHVADGRAEQEVQYLERIISVLVEEPRVGGSDIFLGHNGKRSSQRQRVCREALGED